MSDSVLALVQIVKSYPEQPQLLEGINIQLPGAGLACLQGASGSGKTTLLRLIAGLEKPDQGQIWFAGQNITDLPARQRGFGLMFQGFALFPHLTVARNIAFGLEVQHQPPAVIRPRVDELLDMMRLPDYGGRRVDQLSEGQKQRVALARCLAPRPRLLLLDEPLSSLDSDLKLQLRQELKNLLQKAALPAIYVTHDQEEAKFMGDMIWQIKEGHILTA